MSMFMIGALIGLLLGSGAAIFALSLCKVAAVSDREFRGENFIESEK